MSDLDKLPWTASRDYSGGEVGLWSVLNSAGEVVFFGMSESVARVIAAAPDLYSELRGSRCPRPCNGRPDEFTVGECVDVDECGCATGAALSKAES